MEDPTHLQLAWLAIGTSAGPDDREIRVPDRRGDTLQVLARPIQQLVVELQTLARQRGRRLAVRGERHSIILVTEAENLLGADFIPLLILDPDPGPDHLDDGLVRHQHADGIHAWRQLPFEIGGSERASLLL